MRISISTLEMLSRAGDIRAQDLLNDYRVGDKFCTFYGELWYK